MQTVIDAAARAALWQTFAAKAEAAGATVERVADDAAAAALVAGAAATRGLADRFPRSAAACSAAAGARAAAGGSPPPPPSVQPVHPAQAAHQDGARAAAREVAAAARFAVAETGSVALGEANEDRAACFLADRLLLLVPEAEIVATLDAGLARLAALVRGGARYITLMTGPSRTADIERTLTIGVHGPRALVIVVVGRGAAADDPEAEAA